MLRFPRYFGVLVMVWGLRAIPEAVLTGDPYWVGAAVLWMVASGYLIALQRVTAASLGVLALVGMEMIARVSPFSGLQLFAWIALIIAVTERRPADRALLLRTCVTVVYSFAALTKLNPSWLAGEGIAGLISGQPQLSLFQSIADSRALAVAAAVAVIALEGWLAVGLWNRHTRFITAVVGTVTHAAFVIGASPDQWSAVHLFIFNFGLVVCYPAFWESIQSPPSLGMTPELQELTR